MDFGKDLSETLSDPVHRSGFPSPLARNNLVLSPSFIHLLEARARVAELVDAPDLGSGAERRGGSSPPPGTISFLAFLVAGITSRFSFGNELPTGLRILPVTSR